MISFATFLYPTTSRSLSHLCHLGWSSVTSGHLDTFTTYNEIALKNALRVTVVTLVTSFQGGGAGKLSIWVCCFCFYNRLFQPKHLQSNFCAIPVIIVTFVISGCPQSCLVNQIHLHLTMTLHLKMHCGSPQSPQSPLFRGGGGGLVKLFMCDPGHHNHLHHLGSPSITSGHLDTFTHYNEIHLNALWVTIVTLVTSF